MGARTGPRPGARRAAHELSPIVEKAKLSRANFTFGQMEASLLVALRNLACFILSELCGLGQKRHRKRVRGHTDVGDGKHWLPCKGSLEKGLNTVFGPVRFSRSYYHSADPKDSRWPRDEEPDYLATVTGSYQEAGWDTFFQERHARLQGQLRSQARAA